mgnify:CR=1 FL=1
MEGSIKYNQIVFIDEEDTSFAPFAAKLLEKKLRDRRIYQIETSSRGTVVLFDEPANPKVSEIAWSFGINLSQHRSKELEPEIFNDTSLFLCLDNRSRLKALEKCLKAADIYTLREYVMEQGDVFHPVGGSIEQYETACRNVERLVDLLLVKLGIDEENEKEYEAEENE